jgi:hypothetical protein
MALMLNLRLAIKGGCKSFGGESCNYSDKNDVTKMTREALKDITM